MRTIHTPWLETVTWDFLFPHTFCRQRLLPPLHPGQASYVWEVTTTTQTVIVRTTRFRSVPDEDFWQGAWRLFGADTRRLERLAAINARLRRSWTVPVPRVLRYHRYQDRLLAVVERLPGTVLNDFSRLPDTEWFRIGQGLARTHQHTWSRFGPPTVWTGRSSGWSLDEFWPRLEQTLEFLKARYYAEDPALDAYWTTIRTEWPRLTPPQAAVPIMLDWDPTQFLVDGDRLTGLVDTELYVTGPVELELVGVEYFLTARSVTPFVAGYTSVRPIPAITPYRRIYRLLLRLMSFQGPVSWTTWMTAPEWLD